MRRARSLAICAAALYAFGPSPARAFSLGDLVDPFDVPGSAEAAARWSPETGLADRLQVGVMPGFAEAFGASSPAEITALRAAVHSALLAWESPSVRFEVLLEDPDWDQREIALEAAMIGGPFFGFTTTTIQFRGDRTLTSGQASPGAAITSAWIQIDPLKTLQLAADFGYDDGEKTAALGRLVMHEVGHALGLFHPNGDDPVSPITPNLDDDMDPLNPIFVDPTDPFSALLSSGSRDGQAIMSNTACGVPPTNCPALLYTELRSDDRGGRDVLYPYAAPLIDVVPSDIDFGMVEVGRSSSQMATVSNVGTTPLTLTNFDTTLSLSANCGPPGFGCVAFVATPPAAPLELAPGEAADYTWTCVANSPGSSLADGGAISSDDPLRPLVGFRLSCQAVASEPTPDELVAEVAAFVDESVADGTLAGSGPGNSAEGRLGAFRNKLEATGDRFATGDDVAGCAQLAEVRRRADGASRPPDFVDGSARPELEERLTSLTAAFGCQ